MATDFEPLSKEQKEKWRSAPLPQIGIDYAKLSNCPFCGGEDLEVHTDKIAHGPDRVQVCCNTCLTYGPIDDTEIGARIEWNSRPTPLKGKE